MRDYIAVAAMAGGTVAATVGAVLAFDIGVALLVIGGLYIVIALIVGWR